MTANDSWFSSMTKRMVENDGTSVKEDRIVALISHGIQQWHLAESMHGRRVILYAFAKDDFVVRRFLNSNNACPNPLTDEFPLQILVDRDIDAIKSKLPQNFSWDPVVECPLVLYVKDADTSIVKRMPLDMTKMWGSKNMYDRVQMLMNKTGPRPVSAVLMT